MRPLDRGGPVRYNRSTMANVVLELKKTLEETQKRLLTETRRISEITKENKNLSERLKKAETEAFERTSEIIVIKKNAKQPDSTTTQLAMLRRNLTMTRTEMLKINGLIFSIQNFQTTIGKALFDAEVLLRQIENTLKNKDQ